MAKLNGRPTIYTEELADRICDLVATSTLCLDEISDLYPEIPSHDTIYKWRHRHKSFSEKYLQAMHSRGNLYAEETVKIARQKLTYTDGEGNERVDAGDVAWRKMNVNLRIWHASKLAPKTYGDKTVVETVSNSENDILKAEIAALRAQLNEKNRKEY
jgi:hypothetical protein